MRLLSKNKTRRVLGVVIGLAAVVFLLFAGNLAFAQTAGLDEFGASTNLGNQPLIQTVANIINIVLGLLGVVAIVIILYGGWLWLTSRGNEQQIDKAKKVLSGGLIGLIIIMASFAIASFIFKKLFEATGGDDGGCAVPPCTPPCLVNCFGSDYLKTKWVTPTKENVKLCFAPQAGFNYDVKRSSPVNETTFRVEDEAGVLFYDPLLDSYYPALTDPTDDDVIAFAHPNHEFAVNTVYNVTLQSLIGHDLSKVKDIFPKTPIIKRWSFKTGTESDNTAPEVSPPTQPQNNEIDVCRNSPIQAKFNEPMYAPSFKVNSPAATVKLQKINGWGGAVVSDITLTDPSFGNDVQIVTVAAATTLEENTFYKVTLVGGANGIKDACLIPMAADYFWEFQTGTTVNCEPTITAVDPMTGDYGEKISITGINFFLDGEVFFNDFASGNNSFDDQYNILCWNGDTRDGVTVCANKEIIVRVPVGATTGPAYNQDGYTVSTGPVQVKVDRFWSNQWPGFIIGSPFIGELSPGRGGVGQYLTISGWNFGDTVGKVYFIDVFGTKVEAEPPLGCDDWWQETEIVVKVPAVLVGQFYEVQVVTAAGGTNAGNKPSNTEFFEVTADPPGPGICKLDPTSEDILNLPVNVTVTGERFGVAGILTFETIEATIFNPLPYQWTAGEIISQTPIMAGVNALGKGVWRVRVTSGGEISNYKKFIVSDTSSNTTDPYLQVMDQSTCKNNTQSPSPYSNTTNVCTNALLSARFNKPVVDNTLNNNILLTDCGLVATPDCLNGNQVSLEFGDMEMLTSSSNEVIGFKILLASLNTNHAYLATITAGVLALDGSSFQFPPFEWNFSTGTGACSVNSVVLTPPGDLTVPLSDTKNITATANAANCNVIYTSGWNWGATNNGVPPDVYVNMTAVSLVSQNVEGLNMTPLGIPVQITATESISNKSATKDVYVVDSTGGVGCIAAGLPVITDMEPVNGRAQSNITTVVTITGRNFDCSGSVYFGNIKASQAMCGSWGSTKIVVAAPVLTIGPHNVTVVTRLGSSVAATDADAIQPIFTANDIVRPGICSLTPNYGAGGTSVSIKGYNFSDSRGVNDNIIFPVYLNEVFSAISNLDLSLIGSWTNKIINFKVPTPPPTRGGSGDVSVVIDYGVAGGGSQESNKVPFYGEPFITSITPAVAPTGSWVTIRGGNFGSNLGTVTFAGAPRVSSESLPQQCGNTWTDRQIVVKVPSGGVDGLVKVRTSLNMETTDANSKFFDYNESLPLGPRLCRLLPNSTPTIMVPLTVSLYGDGFGTAPPGVNDKINFSNLVYGQQEVIDQQTFWGNTEAEVNINPADNVISGDVTLQRDVDVTVRQCPGVVVAGICLGGWQDVTEQRTVVSNPLYFTVGTTTTGPGTPGDLRVTSFEPADGEINICRNAAITITFDEPVKTSSVSTEDVHLYGVAEQNLVTNPSFENPLGPEWNGTCTSISNSQVQEGTRSMEFRRVVPCFVAGPGASITQDISDLEVGKDYLVSFYWRGSGSFSLSIDNETQIYSGGNNWKLFRYLFKANNRTTQLTITRINSLLDFGLKYLDNVRVSPFITVPGKVVVDKVNNTEVKFISANPLAGDSLYLIKVEDESILSTTGSVLDCAVSTVGCMSTFITGTDICKITTVTIEPGSYVFTAVNEEKSFKATALAPDGQELTAIYNWVKTDPDNVVDITTLAAGPQNVTLQESATIDKNGKAVLNVTADGSDMGAGTKSASADIEVFICEIPYVYPPNPTYNFSFKYCRQRTAADKLLPLLDDISASTPAGVSYEILFNPVYVDENGVEERTEDVIGLRIYDNASRLAPSDWLKYAVDNKLIPSAPAVSPITVDGNPAARGGQTVYVTALNLMENNDPVIRDTIDANEYILSFNTKATSDTQNIYKQLVESWQFNTNIESATDKVKLKNDLQRVFDLQNIKDLLTRYGKLHSFTLPQLTAGTYVSGWSNSKWKSWQQNLGAALGRNLPIDPLNGFNTCPDGYDQNTCWNEQAKEFVCPAGSYIYQYQATSAGKARLYANFEYGNVDWGGGFKVPSDPRDTDPPNKCENAGAIPVYQDVDIEAPYVLEIQKNNVGSGVVISSDGGINCGSVCQASYNIFDQKVTLTATPVAGSSFAGWSPECASQVGNTCIATMDNDKTVTATFTRDTYILSTIITGSGATGSSITGAVASYNYGAVATLTANAAPGTMFTHWSGCTSVSGNVCNVTMTTNKLVVAYFEKSYTLTVNKTGSAGSVTSNPVGINACAAIGCTANFLQDVVVTLTATAGASSVLNTWQGCDSVSGNTCTVTMDDNKNVTANFVTLINYYDLTITKTGSGSGVVESDNITGINCGNDCRESYQENTFVTLQALDTVGSSFISWSGDVPVACGANDSCQVTMNASKNITAKFDLVSYRLNVYIDESGNETGGGTVASNPVGIKCGGGLNWPADFDCIENYTYGQTITLTPTAKINLGYEFIRWDSNQVTCGGKSTCTLIMNRDIQIVAVFKKVFPLSVTKTVTGFGRVYSTPDGIDCGSDCNEEFSQDENIEFFAVASIGSMFTGWSSDPVGLCLGNGTCVVNRSNNDPVTITAEFNLAPNSYWLRVSLSDINLGSVTSWPMGINCPGSCQSSFNRGQVVQLTVIPIAGGSVFIHWHGFECEGSNNLLCSVTMNQDKTITAEFSPVSKTLNVDVNTAGTGLVLSVPAGKINCDETGNTLCTYTGVYPESITLQARANLGYNFNSWSGVSCQEGNLTQNCTIVLTDNFNVIANFNTVQYTVTVEKDLNNIATAAVGTVISSTLPLPANEINCTILFSSCSRVFNLGSDITLTATPAAGYQFNNWSGVACNGGVQTNLTCRFTVSANITVRANFVPAPRILTVNINPAGSGTVTAANINCPSDCTESYNSGTPVSLVATPVAGNIFVNWTGVGLVCASGNNVSPCNFNINSNITVTANFATQHSLTVTTSGEAKTPNTYIVSTPAGIYCETDCTENYAATATVVLRPQIDVLNTVLWQWSGDCSGNNQSCSVPMTVDRNVNAEFRFGNPLTVQMLTGGGRVTSNPAGINCPGDCYQPYGPATNVILTATANTDYNFDGWGGACTGFNTTCTITMNQIRNVTARFIYVSTSE